MAVRLYMDHNVRGPITRGLRQRGVDVLTAFEDGARELPDPAILDRATVLDRVLFTEDDDFLAEGSRRQSLGIDFPGIVYAHQRRISVGTCVEDLEIISKASEPDDLRGKIFFLPLSS